jgi:hypothetical protein
MGKCALAFWGKRIASIIPPSTLRWVNSDVSTGWKIRVERHQCSQGMKRRRELVTGLTDEEMDTWRERGEGEAGVMIF